MAAPRCIGERREVPGSRRKSGRNDCHHSGYFASYTSEKSLKGSEEKFRLIFQNIHDVYYESLPDGTIVEVSPSVERISGYTREELIGASIYDIHAGPEPREKVLAELMEKGCLDDYEVMARDKDGTLIPCSISVSLIVDDHGTPVKMCGTLRDIPTGRRPNGPCGRVKRKSKPSWTGSPQTWRL